MVNEKSINLHSDKNSVCMMEQKTSSCYDVRSEVLCSIGTEKDDPIAARLCYGGSSCIALISEREGSVN